MKKILFCILATLPLAYCMTGCSNDTDYGGFSYFIWANDSDHRITLSVAREYGELVIENEIIEPGESFESGWGNSILSTSVELYPVCGSCL